MGVENERIFQELRKIRREYDETVEIDCGHKDMLLFDESDMGEHILDNGVV